MHPYVNNQKDKNRAIFIIQNLNDYVNIAGKALGSGGWQGKHYLLTVNHLNIKFTAFLV